VTNPKIVVLASENNAKGDLFATCLSALFTSLGYQDFRYNIHKPGREIDVQGKHSRENRLLFAECKATTDPIGGTDINTMVGRADVERRKSSGAQIEVYFVSIAGFRETAIEQEQEAGGNRIILLDAGAIIDELTRGRVVTSIEKAAEKSGKCCNREDLHLDDEPLLLATGIGFVWLFYYKSNHTRAAYTLVHADGNLVGKKAQKPFQKEVGFAKLVAGLEHLGPPEPQARSGDTTSVKRKYFNYIAQTCGEIQFDGLPADPELRSRKPKLENLFVPIDLLPLHNSLAISIDEKSDEANGTKSDRESKPIKLGTALERNRRIALLGLPGSGKSTVIKRLATAYAFRPRKDQVNDSLPDKEWFPIIIRCRHLGDRAKLPILEILKEVRSRAEIPEADGPQFEKLLSQTLQTGSALLLIDGLDEISNESTRIAFVTQLRLFLAMYPSSALVVTSREAGFRTVGSALSGDCEHYSMAPLSAESITALIASWYREIGGTQKEIQINAERCKSAILSNNRIAELASNPLLLTTILLIRRWVTQLPTKRSALYAKAVEVLLISWNVEGHSPLDQDEVIPQLAFVALEMMRLGVQRVFQADLQRMLQQARSAMPDVLSFSKTSPSELISRVELRSSLLLQSGNEMHEGTIQPLYEFRHLLFQEFLAAKAIVEGYSTEGPSHPPEAMLRNFLTDDSWEEVVALTASLSGRRADPLIRELTVIAQEEHSEGYKPKDNGRHEEHPVSGLLADCLSDEVPLAPTTLTEALKVLALVSNFRLGGLFRSRYSSEFLKICSELYTTGQYEGDMTIGGNIGVLECMAIEQGSQSAENQATELGRRFEAPENFGRTALATMHWAYRLEGATEDRLTLEKETLKKILDPVIAGIDTDIYGDKVAALWALAWLTSSQIYKASLNRSLLRKLFEIWSQSKDFTVSRLSAWSIAASPIYDRKEWPQLGLSGIALFEKLDEINQPPSPGTLVPEQMSLFAGLLGSIYAGRKLAMKKSQAERTVRPWIGDHGRLREFVLSYMEN